MCMHNTRIQWLWHLAVQQVENALLLSSGRLFVAWKTRSPQTFFSIHVKYILHIRKYVVLQLCIIFLSATYQCSKIKSLFFCRNIYIHVNSSLTISTFWVLTNRVHRCVCQAISQIEESQQLVSKFIINSFVFDKYRSENVNGQFNCCFVWNWRYSFGE